MLLEPDRELRGTGLEGKLSDALGKLNAITRLFVVPASYLPLFSIHY